MTTALTAEIFARAVIASALSYGDDPAKAIEARRGAISRRCLAPAAVGVSMATGRSQASVARILHLDPTNVSTAKRNGQERFARAAEAAREAVVWHLKARAERLDATSPAPVLDPIQPGGCAPAVLVERAPPPALLAIPCGAEQVVFDTAPPRPAPNRPAPKADAKPAHPKVLRPERAMPKGRRFVNLGEGMTRIEIRPVPERVARMAKDQLDRGADLDFVADCFDLDADALRAAVDAITQGEAA